MLSIYEGWLSHAGFMGPARKIKKLRSRQTDFARNGGLGRLEFQKSGREMAELPLERSHQIYCKLLIPSYAPRWNRTNNPVVKSHLLFCWGVSEALPGNREMDSTARRTANH
jgi:hypothetical protein